MKVLFQRYVRILPCEELEIDPPPAVHQQGEDTRTSITVGAQPISPLSHRNLPCWTIVLLHHQPAHQEQPCGPLLDRYSIYCWTLLRVRFSFNSPNPCNGRLRRRVTFCLEWVTKSSSFVTSNIWNLWVYVVLCFTPTPQPESHPLKWPLVHEHHLGLSSILAHVGPLPRDSWVMGFDSKPNRLENIHLNVNYVYLSPPHKHV